MHENPGIFVCVGVASDAVHEAGNPIALTEAALASIRQPGVVAVPNYDRNALRAGIVHLGVGGFHRAHLATYVDEICRQGNTDWAIRGAGVLPHDAHMADALGSQDHLYTLITRGPAATEVSVIGSIVDYIHAAPDATALIEAIAADDTQIVSLTVTEGGYPVDDTTGAYVADSPNAGPASAFGILAAGLAKRRANGGRPLTVLSCDNVIGNGHVAQAAALGEADRLGDGLADWVAQTITFPNSMVDRITPATTDGDRAWLAEATGITDRWPVVTEPFRQWVIEDEFAADRLPVDDLDIITTTDVEPYELMKLRLLNAGHSCLAYLAALDGIDTVDEALAAPYMHTFTASFLAREAQPVLPPIAGVDVDRYIETLLERFSNPNIGDQISRLCLDGTAKFPKFLLPTVRRQLAQSGSVALSALALAGWCEYLRRPVDSLASDPLLGKAVEHARRSENNPAAFLMFHEVFGEDLSADPHFVRAFTSALADLRDSGVPSAIGTALQEDQRIDDRSAL